MINFFENNVMDFDFGKIVLGKIKRDNETTESYKKVLLSIKRHSKLKQLAFLTENTNSLFRIKKNKLWYNLRAKQRNLIAEDLEKNFNRKIEEDEEVYFFDKYRYGHPLGFFAGRKHFSFRVNFKDYKLGLRPAKYSLQLNPFKININLFIAMIVNILDDNFVDDFYDEFFKEEEPEPEEKSEDDDYETETEEKPEEKAKMDFKFHFLIIIYTKARKNTISRFYIIPNGTFFTHLRCFLWDVLFTDMFYFHLIRSYHKKVLPTGLIHILISYYIEFFINMKFYQVLNKHIEYDFETRTYDSLGNILYLQINSFKFFLKRNLLIRKGSIYLSRKSLVGFIRHCKAEDEEKKKDFFQESFLSLKQIKCLEDTDFDFEKLYDLSLLNEDLLC